MVCSIEDLSNIKLSIKPGYKIFFYGDLGSGKTTMIKSIFKNILNINENVTSPTYIHYKKYFDNIYHFDLYRLESYDDFVNIGGEEIFENEKNISFVEWPELVDKFYKPNIKVILSKFDENNESREIKIINYAS